MAWYDYFAKFYDSALERSYVEQRYLAAVALDLFEGATVVDVPCGTGQSFDGVREGIGSSGTLIGIDLSQGMLDKAHQRIERNAWGNVHLFQQDVHQFDRDLLRMKLGHEAQIDRLHIFLGMTVFPDMHRAFEQLWGSLRPGGRCVIVDVHSPKLSPLGWIVNRVAGADIRRRFWDPLQKESVDFELLALPYRWEHGGQIMLATGVKR